MTIILPVLFKLVSQVLFTFLQTEPVPAFATIKQIPTPAGFNRVPQTPHSFATWLENIQLKKNNTVFLYNGQRKANQDAQFAVLDIPVGTKDLQQCADAVMRLRATWLHEEGRDREIHFEDNEGKSYRYTCGNNASKFNSYLQIVFCFCGTISLEKQLKTKPISQIDIGDVFIRGGSPGHAMIVVDKAVDAKGNAVFMLAQSYMPAQDIHIVRNPGKPDFGPWYPLVPEKPVLTPEWIFAPNQLKTW